MRVLLIVTDLQIGGTPLQVYRLAKGLRQTGIDVAVCCLADKGHVAKLIEKENINVYALQAKNICDLHILLRLAKLINAYKPDICHSFLMHSNIITRIAGKLLSFHSCKIISTICTVERQKNWHMIMENVTFRLADIIVCISNAVLQHCIGAGYISKNRLKVIYPGIDINKIRLAKPKNIEVEHFNNNSANRICFLGRLDPVKRVDLILHALREIRNNHHDINVQFIVIGDGPQRDKLENLAQELKINDIVCFLGFREDYPSILKSCKVYVLASEQEGWGIATAEAIAAGLVPVVSNIDGSREIIEKVGGLTFRVGDRKDLADKLIEAIRMFNNKEFIIDDDMLAFFDYHRETADYVKLYKKLLQRSNLIG